MLNPISSPLALAMLPLAILASTISACGGGSDEATVQTSTNDTTVDSVVSEASPVDENPADSAELQIADNQIDAEVPYPVYPNGTQYRTGGENGLKIVLFQTEDSFEEVDAYYEEKSDMPRLSAMNDYVRYSVNGNDNDPWATDQPGIVIHRFNDEAEREAVGADGTALTNIIMSY